MQDEDKPFLIKDMDFCGVSFEGRDLTERTFLGCDMRDVNFTESIFNNTRMVAETQKQSLDQLGLEGMAAVQYLWIKALIELGKAPDVLILGGGGNVSIPFSP